MGEKVGESAYLSMGNLGSVYYLFVRVMSLAEFILLCFLRLLLKSMPVNFKTGTLRGSCLEGRGY